MRDGQVVDCLDPEKERQAVAKMTLQHIRAIALLSARRRPRTAMPAIKDDFLLTETR